MSFNRNNNNGLHNILDDTIQRFFTNSSDVSLNFLREWVNDPIFISLESDRTLRQVIIKFLSVINHSSFPIQ